MTKKAFTLIELLIVIAIISILAGSAIPYIQDYVDDARIAKARADLNELTNALIRYEMERGYYDEGSQANLVGTYLQSTLVDPWGAAYKIHPNSSTIYSSGGGNAAIIRSFRPTMRLVSVKWYDKDNDGKMSATDLIKFRFTRPVLGTTLVNSGLKDGVITIGGDGWQNILTSDVVDTAAVDSNDPRVFEIKLKTHDDLKNIILGAVYTPTAAVTDIGKKTGDEDWVPAPQTCNLEGVYLTPFP